MKTYTLPVNGIYEDLSSDEFESRVIKDSKAVVLDVRTEEEYQAGHIPGALNLDITSGNFSRSVEALDKDNPMYIYCRSGGRSISACHVLSRAGFKNIYNLEGGIMNYDGKLE